MVSNIENKILVCKKKICHHATPHLLGKKCSAAHLTKGKMSNVNNFLENKDRNMKGRKMFTASHCSAVNVS
jgi:hypothetical protein